jgi:hypothetical protein
MAGNKKMNNAAIAVLRGMFETKFKDGTLKIDRQSDLADQFYNLSKIRISHGTISHYLRKWGYPTPGRGRRPTKQLELKPTTGPSTIEVRLATILAELAKSKGIKNVSSVKISYHGTVEVDEKLEIKL